MQTYFLDDQTFAQFRAYIYDLTGIDYTESKRYLLDTRVRRRARETNMDDGPSYLNFLQTSAENQSEIDLLIDQVSTHETSFFRHTNQIAIFEKIIDEIVDERRMAGNKRIKIWSAACSTGEEPYTLAMVVREKLGGETGWDISIEGTDISSGSIAQARRGRFSERNVRSTPEPYLSKYFRQDKDPRFYTLTPDMANSVKFEAISLIDNAQTNARRDFDIVFCRNVLIYFDDVAKKKVLEMLWKSLVPGGHLVLGTSDSLHGLTDSFQRTQHSVFNFFLRAPDSTVPNTAAAATQGTTPTARAVEAAPSLPPPSALDNSQSLQLKILIERLDRGIRDLSEDLNNSLGKTIDAVSTVTSTLETLVQNENLDPKSRAELRGADRQLMRILLFLQVGDRTQQKTEALRATLQELSDNLLGAEKEAPDLQVSITSFDKNLLPQDDEESDDEDDDGTMSQDDIDALFN